jgi:ABC-type Fe3+-siderophore transport system permease subunit
MGDGHTNEKHKTAIMFGLAVFLLAVVLLSVSIGPVRITVPEIIKIVLHKVGIYRNTGGWQAVQESILFQVRLPPGTRRRFSRRGPVHGRGAVSRPFQKPHG